ncbi:GNAT family N-acetyltransferase [Nonomuraea sp. NPDC050310]|uniref:GNAT family N-acetyltransferase n=1 Tax=Nonomuraea sp. NPDC050310 TaxID=3154935 RepID=UPI0034026C33
MTDRDLDDGVIRLREWTDEDAAWYAETVRDPLIQRFTTDPPTLTAAEVQAAIFRMRESTTEEGFLICDSTTGHRLGNIALRHDGQVGELSYWVAPTARHRGVATRAVRLFTAWSFREVGLRELWLRAHRDNLPSQQVALNAGFHRDPQRDKTHEAKDELWPMLGYRLPHPTP